MTEIRHVTVRDIDFAYLESGPPDGPLALLLHGFPDHAITWSYLLDDLAAAGYHAVAPWTRGYAPTSLAPDGNYQVANLALDAIALADHFAGDRTDAVLIGHDWGAISAYTAAAHAPDRFAKLVTLAVPHAAAVANHFLNEPEQLKRSFYVFLFQTPLADFAVPADDYKLIDFLWATWSPGYTPDPAFMRALKDSFDVPGCLSAAVDYYRFTMGTKPSDPALDTVQQAGNGTISIPTLYLHGATDGGMGAEVVVPDEMTPLFPAGLEFEMVPEVGHFLHREQPAHINARILEFLGG